MVDEDSAVSKMTKKIEEYKETPVQKVIEYDDMTDYQKRLVDDAESTEFAGIFPSDPDELRKYIRKMCGLN